ncbi:MAG TPA: T9SS type A sorting domain-containing protein [Chitinophagaceae bacterium]|nr:T9SS type A sorting domain-containing protein [Chitinophagaceae bacterium]
MKTILPNRKNFLILIIAFLMSCVIVKVQAQSGSGNLTNGLKFDSYSLISGQDLKKGAQYLYTKVNDSTDAIVSIDSLVNGAKVAKIDDNSNGTGYKDAFQPAIKSGNVIGDSYAVFGIHFFRTGTNTPIILKDVNGTALDIDGNAGLKEFVVVDAGAGSTMQYLSLNSDINILQILTGCFKGINALGIERSGIDTSSFKNMFTASNTAGVSSMTIKAGTFTVVPQTTERQYSIYMKGFVYPPNNSTLPVKLDAFNAILNQSQTKVDLTWNTAQEINASHFIVQKSNDGTNYQDIATVFAMGNTSEQTNYAFKDDVSNDASDVIYYRLQMVDIDARYEYSKVRIIRINRQAKNEIKILTYPNPAINELRVTVPANWQNKKIVYQVFNLSGQTMLQTINANSSQTEILNISQLNKGMYFIKLTCEGQTAQQKIIKM